MARYAIKEMFYTLQGEGAQAGRAAVFCRFAGCNLWTGREADRARAICQFCDTDFVGVDGPGGGKFEDAAALADAILATWPSPAVSTDDPPHDEMNNHEMPPSEAIYLKDGTDDAESNTAQQEQGEVTSQAMSSSVGARARPLVVCTGGEPLLQLDVPLIEALHARGFEIAIETNGTLEAPEGIDWICVSPKAGAPLKQRHGHELKLVFPQPEAPPEAFERLGFAHFFLQPMDGEGETQQRNTAETVAYCMAHPQWRLSLQTHKFLGIP